MDTQRKQKKSKVLIADDISIFCAQIALILKSGIPLQEGIVAIGENIEDKNGKAIIDKMSEMLSQNGELHSAFARAGVFPEYMVNMVRIGEKIGKLEPVMESLSIYYERESNLRKRIKSAVLYPAILVLMMCAVFTVLIVKVLPIFQDVFTSLGSDMPAIAMQLMNFGSSLGKYVYILLLLLIIIIAILFCNANTSVGVQKVGRFFCKLFFTKKLSNKIATARFASVMSMTLSSGYHTDEALELALTIIRHPTVEKKVELCRSLIQEGNSFANAIGQAKLFSGIYSRMINIGAKTGNLDEVMKRLADIYHDQADESIERTVALVEPTLVGCLCIIIGIILLTVMLPLMGIMSSIG